MMSTGLPCDQLAGRKASSAAFVAGGSGARSRPAAAAASAAITPAPPPLVSRVSRSSRAPSPAVGPLWWASASAATNRSCSVSTRSMPARRMAASKTMSALDSAPVWLAAACAPCAERPALTTSTGLLRAAARAADMNLRGASIDSM